MSQSEGFGKSANIIGDHVKAGQPILKVDFQLIRNKRKDIIVPVFITNSPEDKFSFSWTNPGKVVAGEKVLFTSTVK
ncbi:hypothetical protein EWI07_01680 [Sporolactobacillus sp. THM7-4]|nr:hypothetical protein EWI07_01680 [Sporolactobacillus sp. THM7-4]